MQYNIDFEICTLIFVAVLMARFFTRKQIGDQQSRAYRIYLIMVAANLSLDIVSCCLIEWYESVPMFWNMLVNTLFLLMQATVPAIFVNYLYIMEEGRRESDRMPRWPFIPMAILVLMLLVNPLTKWIFYFDAGGYQHGPYHIVLYLSPLIYAVGISVYMFVVHSTETLKRKLLVLTAVLVGAGVTCLQYVFPQYSLSGVGLGVSVFIMYLTFENPVVYEDGLTGVRNREAFIHQTDLLREQGLSYQVFAIAPRIFRFSGIPVERGYFCTRTGR